MTRKKTIKSAKSPMKNARYFLNNCFISVILSLLFFYPNFNKELIGRIL